MKNYFELSETEIVKVLAEHFDVNFSDVSIEIYNETVGYGLNEHQEQRIKAVIEEN